MNGSPGTWSLEQVVAVAPSPNSVAAAEPLAVLQRWSTIGADERAIWGRCRGSGAEPYDTAVDHVEVAWRCTCPSRKLPCKHALALLLLWTRGGVPEAARPSVVDAWIDGRDRRAESAAGGDRPAPAPAGADGEGHDSGEDRDGDDRPDRDDLDRSRDERVARMLEGLVELDRWLEDRMRTGLADPALARYATWDALAARLVDARAGALANRVRRLAGLVGAGPDWHAEVLAELGTLHLIAEAGQRLPTLPGNLADAVATVSGWQVRQADVLSSVPETDDWTVMGRSDTREDRIEVRRTWLRGAESGRWALLLSFAAYRQSLDTSWVVGSTVAADLHRYPGRSLRCLAGRREIPAPHATPVMPVSTTIEGACDEIGMAVAAEPWLEHVPVTVTATPTISDGGWVLTDATGALPLVATTVALADGRRRVHRRAARAHRRMDPARSAPAHRPPPRPVDRCRTASRPRLRDRGMTDSIDLTLDAHWQELVTAALLGTERRTPPVAPVPGVADVVDDLVPPDDAARMLATVATVGAVRKAAFLPLPAADPLQPPAPDQRPITPPAASMTWRTVVAEWPLLEDEWMLTVISNGYRLAPDVLVAALVRHRNDPVRRARAALAGGPHSAWLIDHVPQLGASRRTVPAEAVGSLPELAIPADLAELVALDAHTFVRRLRPRFESGEFGTAHRAVLTNLLARCRREVLADAAAALASVGTVLSVPLAELCRLRDRMLSELSPRR